MTDKVSKLQRSKIMSAVRSKDTKMEVAFRKALWQEGFRYRKNSTKHFGKPDIVLKKYETVIFLDSCFWHGCQKHFRMPATRKKYWETKIERNKQRDKEVNRYYNKLGWKIFRVWEHDLTKKTRHNFQQAVKIIKVNNQKNMTKKIVSKTAVKKERDPEKVKKVIEQKGYEKGKLPKGKELHHVIPVAEGGKTTKKNTRVVSSAKHKQIHKNRAKIGKI